MAISSDLVQKIVKLLRVHISNPSHYDAYLISAFGTNSPILSKLECNTSLDIFIPRLINELVAFGKIKTGKLALCAFLEIIREKVGEDVQSTIDNLLSEVENQLLNQQNEMIITPERPLLIGIVVDVSLSMRSSIKNSSNQVQNRFDGFREALHNLINRAKELSQEESTGQTLPLLKLFALGFGFGNPVAYLLRGDRGERVRDFLALPGQANSIVTIDKLFEDWNLYEKNINKMVPKMLGDTPMGQAFQEAEKRLQAELINSVYKNQPILFVLSDGTPTDVSREEIIAIAERLKNQGVLIISCYVTERSVIEPQRLYKTSDDNWEDGARLMFHCASIPTRDSPFYSYLKELGWQVEENSRLFAQINNSEFLSQFFEVMISPLLNKPESG